VDDLDRSIPAYGVHNREDVPEDILLAALRADGWPTYVLPGAPHDWDSFVVSIREVLPLDPPIARGVWDAVKDSLWEGLDQLNVEKVAIVWPESKRMRQSEGDGYSRAVDLFTLLVFELADRKYTVDHVTRLLVLLA
jgi:hypothetical protein